MFHSLQLCFVLFYSICLPRSIYFSVCLSSHLFTLFPCILFAFSSPCNATFWAISCLSNSVIHSCLPAYVAFRLSIHGSTYLVFSNQFLCIYLILSVCMFLSLNRYETTQLPSEPSTTSAIYWDCRAFNRNWPPGICIGPKSHCKNGCVRSSNKIQEVPQLIKPNYGWY